jgi:CRISPR/Cas system-associated exonuclease Cas4 (RecB family)
MRPVVFSASSANTYLDCHLRWYFSYVLGEPGIGSEPQRVGIKIHDFAEKSLRNLGTAFLCDDPEIDSLATVWNRDILPTYAPDYVNILRDLKSTGKRPPAGKYRFNMVGYYLGVTEGLGYEVHAIQLDYIVRTQKPYYWPEVVPIPEEDDIQEFAATLETVANGVARGDYEATGLGTYVCGYCPHQAICGPYARFKEITNA